KVIAPADSYETAKALAAAIETEGPVYMRIGRSFEPPMHKSTDFEFEIGKAIQIHEGTDITVIACGRTVLSALIFQSSREWQVWRCRAARVANSTQCCV
ncbi:MAG: hypothetical protein GY813_00845, partial [Halieaceae bacterium]|nr:hypothetical protein [Halieaceae bacterium]